MMNECSRPEQGREFFAEKLIFVQIVPEIIQT